MLNLKSQISKILAGIFLSLLLFSLTCAAAAKINVKHQEAEKAVKLTWDKVSDASYYKVYRDGTDISARLTSTSFSDSTAQSGEKYTYTVVAYDSGGKEISRGSPSDKIGLSKTEEADSTGSTGSTSPEGEKIPIGAKFPGEPSPVGLVEHIFHVHKWAAGIGSLLAILMIVFAGFKYATSSGNPEALQDAKDTIIGALIGLAIIILTYFLLQIFGVELQK